MKKLVGVILLFFLFVIGCGGSTKPVHVLNDKTQVNETQIPAFTATPIVVPTCTLTPSPTNTPTLTPTNTPTPSPTNTPTPTPTSTPTPTPDVEAPVITLNGEASIEVIAQSLYVEPGYTAMDSKDGDLTGNVIVSGTVDLDLCGTYVLSYEVADEAGNSAKAERTVIVKQPETVTPEGKVIYLTFDDGPGRYTNDVLAILEKYNIKATFFTCGNGQPSQVKKIHDAGHTIAIHCKSHDYEVVYASEEAYFKDLYTMQELVYEWTGVKSTMLRFPGGSSNEVSKFNPGIMTRLTKLVEQKGFQYYDWNVSSSDTSLKNPEDIFENVKKKAGKYKAVILLLHSEVKKYSMEAVEDIIIWGMENGYRFLPLDPSSPKAHHSVHN